MTGQVFDAFWGLLPAHGMVCLMPLGARCQHMVWCGSKFWDTPYTALQGVHPGVM